MIVVKIAFKKQSEGLKAYKIGDKITHFDKETESHLVKHGYAEFVKTEKKAAPKRTKKEKK